MREGKGKRTGTGTGTRACALRFLATRAAAVARAALVAGGLLPALLLTGALPPAPAATLRLFAASSLGEPLDRIARSFEESHPGVRVEVHLAGSGTLLRQLEQGAEADLFAPASTLEVEALIAQGRVAADAVSLFAANRLAVVARGEVAGGPEDAGRRGWKEALLGEAAPGEGPGRIAVPHPGYTPSGRLFRQAAEAGGIWEELAPRLLLADDVRTALAYVERGEAAAGVAFRTDALTSERVREVAEIPPELHDPALYPIAVLAGTRQPELAREFAEALRGPEGQAVLRRLGFLPPPAGAPAAGWGAGPEAPESAPRPASGERGATTASLTSLWPPLLVSIRVAGAALLLVLGVGLPLAYALARATFPGKAVVDALVDLPLVLPPSVVGYLLLVSLGSEGWLGSWLDRVFGIRLAFTWGAAVIAAAAVSLPFLVRTARAAFESVPRAVEEAGFALGAGPASVARRITLPLAARGVLAGATLAFARALGEFGATLLVAGNIPGETQTLSLAVYTAIQSGDEEGANRLALLLALFSLAALAGLRRWGERAAPPGRG